MIEQTLHAVKIDFAIFIAFWDLSIKSVLLSSVGKPYGCKMMTALLRSKDICANGGKVIQA